MWSIYCNMNSSSMIQQEGKRVNRDILITYYQILKIVLNSSINGNGSSSGANATKLIYGARLSAETYKSHINNLVEKGLITSMHIDNNPYKNYTAFQITDNGLRFIELVKGMKNLLPNDNGLYILPRHLDSTDDEYHE